MEADYSAPELLFVFSEAEVKDGRFAIGLVAKDSFDEVRTYYLEEILTTRFPLYLLHPDSVVHLLREAPLAEILKRRPTAEGVFIAVLPRRISNFRDKLEETLRYVGFTPLDDLRWRLEVKPSPAFAGKGQ